MGDIAPADTLAETLRERLLLTGTKISCDDGACGCCTVIMNGKAIPSCTVLTIECDGADIRTIEGLQDPNTGELDKVQQAFVDHSAFQCGYCTPGIIMTTEALLAETRIRMKKRSRRLWPETTADASAITRCWRP